MFLVWLSLRVKAFFAVFGTFPYGPFLIAHVFDTFLHTFLYTSLLSFLKSEKNVFFFSPFFAVFGKKWPKNTLFYPHISTKIRKKRPCSPEKVPKTQKDSRENENSIVDDTLSSRFSLPRSLQRFPIFENYKKAFGQNRMCVFWEKKDSRENGRTVGKTGLFVFWPFSKKSLKILRTVGKTSFLTSFWGTKRVILGPKPGFSNFFRGPKKKDAVL